MDESTSLGNNNWKNLTLIWSVVGVILSTLSLLSLFGDLRLITFSELINNIILSYRDFVHPILDFLNPFSFQLSKTEKDEIFLLFFSFERLAFSTFLESKEKDNNPQARVRNRKSIIGNWLIRVNSFLSPIYKKLKSLPIGRMLFRVLMYLMVIIFVKTAPLPLPEDISEFFFILCLCLLFVPVIIISYRFLGAVVSSSIRYYLSLPVLILISKVFRRKKALAALKAKKMEIDLEHELEMFKTRSKPIIHILYFNLSVLILSLLILGLNFYFKNLGI